MVAVTVNEAVQLLTAALADRALLERKCPAEAGPQLVAVTVYHTAKP